MTTRMPPLAQMPRMLYGTAWKKESTTRLVVQAVLEGGFRGLDTACQPKHYNQELVGAALKILREDHGIPRESLWLQTKFTSLNGQDLSQPLPYDKDAPLDAQVRASFATSLRELGTTYLDSLVLHSPMDTREETMIVWQEWEKLVKEGKVRRLGISNEYNPEDLKWAFETFDIKPTIVQNRFAERYSYGLPILSLCHKYGAQFQSFWTLSANPDLLKSPSLKMLAPGLSPEQALFAFLLATERFGRGTIVPLSGTTSVNHMKEDTEVVAMVERGDVNSKSPALATLEARIWG